MIEKSGVAPHAQDWWSNVLDPMWRFGGRLAEFFAPSSEAAATDDAYEVSVELPGVDGENIRVELHEGLLSVSGEKKSSREESGKDFYFSERTYGRFNRGFRLPPDANPDAVRAEHKDGVLTVRVGKVAPKAPDVRKISVKHG